MGDVIRIENYLRQARRVASRFPESAVADRDDHNQEAVIGLMQAAGRFRPERGVGFGAFAERRMRGEVSDSLRRLDPLPRAWREAERAAEDAERRLAQTLRREPTIRQTAKAAGLGTDTLRLIYSASGRGVSLDAIYPNQAESDDKPVSAVEKLVDEAAEEGARRVLADEQAAAIEAMIATLSTRQQYVIRARYFMDLSNHDVAATLGVTISRASQIHATALARLRALLEDAQKAA